MVFHPREDMAPLRDLACPASHLCAMMCHACALLSLRHAMLFS